MAKTAKPQKAQKIAPLKLALLRIELLDTETPIWRKVLVDTSLPLKDLHQIIQTTMGWNNGHLHQFININGKTFYVCDEYLKDDNTINYLKSKVLISDLLKRKNSRLFYEYDFGDSWAHLITLEETVVNKEQHLHPVCTEGAMRCPFEDCGGVWGYDNIKNVLKDPKHADYSEFVEWYGKDFDPEEFDLKQINKLLSMKNYGVVNIH